MIPKHLLVTASLLAACTGFAEQWTKSDSNAWSNAASWTDSAAGSPTPPGTAGGSYTDVRINLQGGTTLYTAAEGVQTYDVSPTGSESRGLVMSNGGGTNSTLSITGGELIFIQEAAVATVAMANSANTATINLTGGKLTINETDSNGDTLTAIGFGGAGTGIMNINSGGVLTTHLAQLSTSGGFGTLNLNGGGVIVTNRIFDGGGTSSFVADGGTIQVRDNKSGAVNLIDASLDTATLNAGGLTVDTTAASATINKALDGVGGLTKSGANSLTLSAASSYAGGTTVNAGTLTASVSAGATGAQTTLGSGAITANAGTTLRFLSASTTNAQSYANAINLNGATFVSSDAVVTYSGAIALTGANTIRVDWNGKDAIFSGIVSGAGSLNKINGSDTNTKLVLSGLNTYTGGTTVTSGTINIAATGGIRVGASGVTLLSGATLAVDGKLTLTASNASIVNNGTIAFAGSGATIAVGALFDGISGNTYQLITGSGTLTNAGSVSFDLTGSSAWSTAVLGTGGLVTFTAIPEPSTYGLLGAGALAASAFVRRRKKSA